MEGIAAAIAEDFRRVSAINEQDKPCRSCGAMLSYLNSGWRHSSLGSATNWKASRECRGSQTVVDYRLFAWRSVDLSGWYFNGRDTQGWKLTPLQRVIRSLKINWIFTRKAWAWHARAELRQAKYFLTGAN